MPRYASVAGRPVSRMRLAPSRRERQLHPDVGARVAVVVGDLPEPVAAVEPHRGLEPALAVETQRVPPQRARLLQHAGHQPGPQAAAPARPAPPPAPEPRPPPGRPPPPRRPDHPPRTVA